MLAGSSTFRNLGLFALVFAVISGCTSSNTLTESKKTQLEQRVSDRWQCLAVNDYACAYEFLSPDYRAVFSLDMYLSRFSKDLERRLTGVKVVEYHPDSAVASVTVRVMSKPIKFTSAASRAIGALPASIDESWIWKDGGWWVIEKPSKL